MSLALCIALAAPAAPVAGPPDMYLSYGISNDGSGHLFAAPLADGPWSPVAWQACTPDGVCSAVASSPDDARQLDAADAAAGTTFVATASDGKRSISATSPPYRGRLAFYSPPSVSGSARTGHFVRPLAGTWFGGWGDERPLMQLQACRTRRASSCTVIADTVYWDKCPGTGARIAPRYRGWYLRVAEIHAGRDVVFADRAYTRPEAINSITNTSAITAIATVGRIKPGRGPNRPC
jgi:hypothetical protein